jgi:hypothetical protein
MTMKVQLDTKAMNELFPEGSECRVQLQQAVIQNYAQATLKGCKAEIMDSVRSDLRLAVSEVRDEVRKEHEAFTKELVDGTNSWSNNYKLTEKGKEFIKSQAEQALLGDMYDNLEQFALDKLKSMDYEAMMDRQVSHHITNLSRRLTAERASEIKTKVSEIFKGLADEY